MKSIKKIGAVFGIAVLTSAILFLMGVAVTLLGNIGWIHLGEYQPWLPLIGLEYGFPLGIFIGLIVTMTKGSKPH